MSDKALLREEILAKRNCIASPSVSAYICEKAAALPVFRSAETVMLYLNTNSEVETARLIALCKRTGKKICAPRILNSTKMEAAMFDNQGFRKGKFGIWEPLGLVPSSVDLIFVPGVVFDRHGHRIGYGKGYYDRFLRDRDLVTIGLAYECQIADDIPIYPHDICLNMVLTEERCYP